MVHSTVNTFQTYIFGVFIMFIGFDIKSKDYVLHWNTHIIKVFDIVLHLFSAKNMAV